MQEEHHRITNGYLWLHQQGHLTRVSLYEPFDAKRQLLLVANYGRYHAVL
jgi:hypothetical protein